MAVFDDAYHADRLQHQMPVFYLYCKYLYVIKSTAYFDDAAAEVYFNPIYINRASVPLHQSHHAPIDTDEATDAGGMTCFSHVNRLMDPFGHDHADATHTYTNTHAWRSEVKIEDDDRSSRIGGTL